MGGFDIHSPDGTYLGHSESENPQVAVAFFLRSHGDWAISVIENDDGTLSVTHGEQTVVLKPAT